MNDAILPATLGRAANRAPFRLSLACVPPRAYTARRWQIDATRDEPYRIFVVLHVLHAEAAQFGHSG